MNFSIDDKPVIKKLGKNLYISTNFGSHGFMQAYGSGYIIANYMNLSKL